MACTLNEQIEEVRAAIKDEYRQAHSRPWIIGFSGGKDSTLMLHLVVEALMELPWSERTRSVYVIANDTLVESPIVQSFVDETLTELGVAFADLDLPVRVVKTTPAVDHTFWVNLIGRGYPAPTRMFRWCTDRMKIRPTTSFIRNAVNESGEVILLLGVRRLESTQRSKNAKRYDNGSRLNPHNDIQGCLVYRPILELSTDDVWEFLGENSPPWGGNYRRLFELYRNAAGGECPVVIDPDAAPSCGSSSIRFGCWTCTVVEKDRSFRAGIEKGFESLLPMADFRDWLLNFCYEPANRMPTRRNGMPGLGPLTFSARKAVLEKLQLLEKAVDTPLISQAEVVRIKEIWDDDTAHIAIRGADRLLELIEGA
jgi:DNA sulfur modification protein DndC